MIIFGQLLGALMTIVVYGAYILIISFTLWMAVDAAKQDRFWWVTLIIGIPVIGSAIYFFTEKKHVYAVAPSHHVHTSLTEIEHETSPKKHEKKEKFKKLAEETSESKEVTKPIEEGAEISHEEKKEDSISA